MDEEMSDSLERAKVLVNHLTYDNKYRMAVTEVTGQACDVLALRSNGEWIEFEITPELNDYLNAIPIINLKQRVLDFLLTNFKCNTHSLRYAFINYMLYEKKVEMTLVAKFVGHVDVSMLVRYSQNKNADNIFDLD